MYKSFLYLVSSLYFISSFAFGQNSDNSSQTISEGSIDLKVGETNILYVDDAVIFNNSDAYPVLFYTLTDSRVGALKKRQLAIYCHDLTTGNEQLFQLVEDDVIGDGKKEINVLRFTPDKSGYKSIVFSVDGREYEAKKGYCEFP